MTGPTGSTVVGLTEERAGQTARWVQENRRAVWAWGRGLVGGITGLPAGRSGKGIPGGGKSGERRGVEEELGVRGSRNRW